MTEALHVLSSRQVEFDDGDRVLVELAFSDKVLPQRAWHLKGNCADGWAGNSFHAGDVAGKTVRVITDAVAALMNNKEHGR